MANSPGTQPSRMARRASFWTSPTFVPSAGNRRSLCGMAYIERTIGLSQTLRSDVSANAAYTTHRTHKSHVGLTTNLSGVDCYRGMRNWRIGVVGVGHVGSNHARLYAETPSAE